MITLNIAKNISVANVIAGMKSDLNVLGFAIRAGEYSSFEEVNPSVLALHVKQIEQIANTMAQSQANEARKLLRHYIFILKKHGEHIVADTTMTISMKLRKTMDEISGSIGETPRLNSAITLPNPEFLPVKIESSKRRWKTIPCSSPSRTAKTIDDGKISFLDRGGINSVRASLKAQLKGKKLVIIRSGIEEYHLNLVDHEYYQVGLLDADHLLSSSNINSRLKEMIEMMNYDPDFRREMEESAHNDGYFISQGEQVIGSYWLYMAHHNAMQNLWFLLSSDNSGSGKVAIDPIEWFKSKSIGQEYLESLKQAGKSVDKKGIFYIVLPDGTAFKDSFVTWVESNNKRLIQFCNIFAQFHYDMRREMEVAVRSNQRHQGPSEANIKLHRTVRAVTNKSHDESSLSGDSGMGSEDREEIERATMQDIEANPEYRSLEKRLGEIERETFRKNKRKFDEEKSSRSSNKTVRRGPLG
ncbi:MAG: hypothetical protein NXI01_10185 [Gammaproteobacteria bacterium]|nr:hypothetical protein [Gammaproteobacteria bacterium]